MPTDSEPRWTLDRVNDAIKAFPNQPRYQYHPLKPERREIRLLKISLPATHDPIPCLELEAKSIDSAPPFQAISYYWGDSKKSFQAPILDHGRRESADGTNQSKVSWIAVTESLAEMLAYLPRHCIPPGDTSSYIWIDQLCINQSEDNSPEKANQINLMGEIYSRATQVLIWLGPGPTPEDAERIPNINVLGMSPLSSQDKFALRYVWKNWWFERTWVVQESSLAKKRQALVGLHPVRWEFIEKQIGLQWLQSAIPSRAIDVDPSAIARHVSAVIMWREFEQISGNCDASRGLLLCSFLARFGQHLQLREPRDRVLAFMSLWNPPSFDIPSTSGENAGEVYTRLAISLVKDTKRLDVLAALRTGPVPGDTFPPSWVPRWDVASPPSPLMAATYSSTTLSPLSTMRYISYPGHETALILTPSTIQWKASSPYNEHQDLSEEDSTLKTRGKIICSIEGVLPPITHHPVSEDAIEQFRSSLHFNEHSITIQEAIKILVECSELGRPDELSGRGPLHDLQRLIAGESASQDAIDGLVATHGLSMPLYNSTGRRFFKTTWRKGMQVPDATTSPEGMQMLSGLGPGWTEIGDDIAILHGCRFPVILRKAGEKSRMYRVVGDCYIPEIMKGEAVYWAKEEADIISLV